MTKTPDLARLAVLEERATPGPWRYNPDTVCRIEHANEAIFREAVFAGTFREQVCVVSTGDADDPQSMIDAEFIARARNAVPELLAEISRLRTDLTDLENWVESYIAQSY